MKMILMVLENICISIGTTMLYRARLFKENFSYGILYGIIWNLFNIVMFIIWAPINLMMAILYPIVRKEVYSEDMLGNYLGSLEE